MMTPNAVRLMSQDFPENVRVSIQRLITPVNQFMTHVTTVLNKGLTFKDHMNAEIKTIRLTREDRPTISHSLKSRPIGVIILSSQEEVTTPLFVDWINIEGGIKIRRIVGLEPKKTYTLTLLILGG